MEWYNYWCVEYSKEQKAFHIDTLSKAVSTNRGMFLRKASNDYQIIGIYKTAKEASKACKLFRERKDVWK